MLVKFYEVKFVAGRTGRVSQLVGDVSVDTTLPPGNRPDVWELHEKAYRIVFQPREPIDHFADFQFRQNSSRLRERAGGLGGQAVRAPP